MNRAKSFKIFKEAFSEWNDLNFTQHIMSPMDPRKKRYRELSDIWLKEVDKDPQLLELYEDDRLFRQIFGLDK